MSKWEDYRNTTVYDTNHNCAAGKGFIFVESTGYAYPCAYIKGLPGVEGVNLLEQDWNKDVDLSTPCTKCIVGPLLEFNLLFNNPVSSTLDALDKVQW